MAKVAVFLANGCEEVEALTPVDILRRGGIEVTVVSITNSLKVEGSHGIRMEADAVISEMDLAEYDMVVLPGGMPGTRYLEADARVIDTVKEFAVNPDKYIAAICAAPTVFGRMGVLMGKKATCYGGMEADLLGAEVITDRPVVRDGHIITSRGAGTAVDFGLALLEVFTDRETADDMAAKIMFR